jgi:hypothetical protein
LEKVQRKRRSTTRRKKSGKNGSHVDLVISGEISSDEDEAEFTHSESDGSDDDGGTEAASTVPAVATETVETDAQEPIRRRRRKERMMWTREQDWVSKWTDLSFLYTVFFFNVI